MLEQETMICPVSVFSLVKSENVFKSIQLKCLIPVDTVVVHFLVFTLGEVKVSEDIAFLTFNQSDVDFA